MPTTQPAADTSPARPASDAALLDAAERLLVDVGYAGITTRAPGRGRPGSTTVSSTTTSARTSSLHGARAASGSRSGSIAPPTGPLRVGRPRSSTSGAPRCAFLVGRRSPLREDLARAPGARLEPPGRPRAPRAVNAEWRTVLTDAFAEPHRELERRDAARRARVPGHDLQPRSHRRTTRGRRRRAPRPPGMDRSMAHRADRRRNEQTRARVSRPVRRRSTATASASRTRCTAPANGPSCCCPRGRSSIRGSGRCRSRTSPATSCVVTFDGRGNGRSDRPAGRRGVRRDGVRRRRPRGVGRHGHRAGGRRRSLDGRAAGTRCSPPRIPSASLVWS